MSTLHSLLNPGYEPGDGSADDAQLVDGQWWDPLFGCDSLQYVVDNARQAPPLEPVMDQAAWQNVAICAARRSEEFRQLCNQEPNTSRRREYQRRELDEWSTVSFAFNKAVNTRVLISTSAFPWMDSPMKVTP